MAVRIKEIYIEYQKNPIGLDEKHPRISWLLESDEKNIRQTGARILVKNIEYKDAPYVVFDTGRMETNVSTGIPYTGDPLQACTRYEVSVQLWMSNGETIAEDSFFETGLLDPSVEAWEGAQWIGASKDTVSAQNRGVFVMETEFCFLPDTKRAGVVFGANDERLASRFKNEFGLEGENYIRFEIEVQEKGEKSAFLKIYRVGYAQGDSPEHPFACIPLAEFGDGERKPLLHSGNLGDFHKLRIVIDGNNSFTYFDDKLADVTVQKTPFGELVVGRMLNPRGFNDVLTYPHLNDIGFFAGKGQGVLFKNLVVKNLREPSRVFIKETPEGNLDGEASLFAELPVRDGCFLVKDRQITRDPTRHSMPMFRTVFKAEPGKRIRKARLYVTSRGIYQCQVNGKDLEQSLLSPGLTQYDKRMNYQTYNLTELLHEGKNALGITLGSGWWCDAQTFVVKNYNYFGDKEALLAKLVIDYEDGERSTVLSDCGNWKCFVEGPWLFSGFFAGERFDARKREIAAQYGTPGFDDSSWEAPVVCDTVPIAGCRTFPGEFGRAWQPLHEQKPLLEGGYDAPVKVIEKRCARSVRRLTEGIYIYDLEQEMAGVPRIRVKEKAGTRIVLRYAEVLYPEMEEYAGRAGTMMLENYRDAGSTDIYICSGDPEGEIIQPRFTFHGFRYIEISGVTQPPALSEVEGLQYSSIADFAGTFSSSDKLLDRFVQNVYWSQKCNFINIPTDCPQRNERMGWAGDTHIFCHTALQNADLKLFYERNLQAMADLQTAEGQYPEIAPVGGGFGGITYECASIFMAWELYQQYGDIRTLERFYPGMKKYMKYMEDKGLPGKGDDSAVGPLGDWLAVKETDLSLLWNAFYYREAFLMAKIAGRLGYEADEENYRNLAERTKQFWNEKFVDERTGKTRNWDGALCDTQTSYTLGIAYGVMDDKAAAGRLLQECVERAGDTIETGFFGTGLINQALCDCGYSQTAEKLMLQTAFPSWLYPVTQGATTIWERWDSYTKEKGFGGQNAMNSFNHYSLGSVLSWLYHHVFP